MIIFITKLLLILLKKQKYETYITRYFINSLILRCTG